MTLLRLDSMSADVGSVKLDFTNGPKITHILTATAAIPKTIFDFDLMQENPKGEVEVRAGLFGITWVALFGETDGYLEITAGTVDKPQESSSVSFGFMCVVMLIGALLVLNFCKGASAKVADFFGLD